MSRQPKKTEWRKQARAHGPHQDGGRFSAAEIDEENAADGAENGNAAEDKRINDGGGIRRQRLRRQDGSTRLTSVDLKNVRSRLPAQSQTLSPTLSRSWPDSSGHLPRVAFDFAHQIRFDILRPWYKCRREGRAKALIKLEANANPRRLFTARSCPIQFLASV